MIVKFEKLIASSARPTLGQEGYGGAYNMTEVADDSDSLVESIVHYDESVTAADITISNLESRLYQPEMGGPINYALQYLVMIPAEVNSRSGPLSSDTLFALIGDNGYIALDWQLYSGSGGSAFIVISFSCKIFFSKIGDDAVIPRDYQLDSGSVRATFTVTSFSGDNYYAWFGDDKDIAWGCWLDGGMCSDLDHATKTFGTNR